MPIFLVPIVAGVYLYFEKKKREAEEQGKDENVNDKVVADMQSSYMSDNGSDEVIETQLSRESSSIGMGPRVEVTFEDCVPDQQESQVSDDESDEDAAMHLAPQVSSEEKFCSQKTQRVSLFPLVSCRKLFKDQTENASARETVCGIAT